MGQKIVRNLMKLYSFNGDSMSERVDRYNSMKLFHQSIVHLRLIIFDTEIPGQRPWTDYRSDQVCYTSGVRKQREKIGECHKSLTHSTCDASLRYKDLKL